MPRNDQYALCPYCNEPHGDCGEWLTSERPQDVECGQCRQVFKAWAEYHVQYVTQAICPQPAADKAAP